MSETRYTRKDAEQAFSRLCDALGKRQARSYNDVGAWTLDYNPTYGGAVVREIISETGGQTSPLPDRRQSPRQFCESVWFALRVVDVDRTRPR